MISSTDFLWVGHPTGISLPERQITSLCFNFHYYSMQWTGCEIFKNVRQEIKQLINQFRGQMSFLSLNHSIVAILQSLYITFLEHFIAFVCTDSVGSQMPTTTEPCLALANQRMSSQIIIYLLIRITFTNKIRCGGRACGKVTYRKQRRISADVIRWEPRWPGTLVEGTTAVIRSIPATLIHSVSAPTPATVGRHRRALEHAHCTNTCISTYRVRQ